MSILTIKRGLTPAHDQGLIRYTAEASEQGLAPGFWPTKLRVQGFGNGNLFYHRETRKRNGETLFAKYTQDKGCIDIIIYND